MRRDRAALYSVIGALLASPLLASACATAPAESPAVLASADTQSMEVLRETLAAAMGVASVELGAGDPSSSPAVTVLPRRASSYETNSTATPTAFDIVLRGERCFVIRRETGEAYELKGVSCRLAGG